MEWRVDGVVEAGLVGEAQRLLEEVLGVVLEGGVESQVAQLAVLLLPVIAEVDEVLNVVVRSDVLYVLPEMSGRRRDEVRERGVEKERERDRGRERER